MSIKNVQLSTTATTVLQATTTTAVLALIFCNLSANSETITVYAYPSGGSANATSTILSSVSINASDTFVWTADEKFILDAGDVISALASTASVISVTPSYMVIS